jgi:uncharacterized membrane protein
MDSTVLGVILIVLGLIAITAGIGGGIATMFLELRRKAQANRTFSALDLPVEFIQALTEFLKALTAAPQWAALIVVGILLVGWGGFML